MAIFVETQTIKIPLKALVLLRLLTVKTGERQYAILYRLIAQEAMRLINEPVLYGPIPADTPEAFLSAAV